MGNDGRAIINHTEVKQLLDLARAACRDKPNPIPAAYGPFNAATDDGRNMSLYSGLLAHAIRTIVDVKEDKDLDSLFTGKRTTALTQDIAGLDDFELLSFLVITEPEVPSSAYEFAVKRFFDTATAEQLAEWEAIANASPCEGIDDHE
jgi:hypothetical protein